MSLPLSSVYPGSHYPAAPAPALPPALHLSRLGVEGSVMVLRECVTLEILWRPFLEDTICHTGPPPLEAQGW